LIPKELLVESVKSTYKRLSPYVIKTPLVKGWNIIDEILNTNSFFKMEFLQNSGTFKVRGATNNVLNLTDDQKLSGITAVSAGNHAISTSYVANKFKLKNKIFIYNSANKFRIDMCRDLNANLSFTDPHNAFKQVEIASKKDGYYFIHPFDGPFTLQGTASLGFEICKQIENIDNILISVGGGGLISGIGSVIKQLYPKCNIIGIEPEGAQGMSESFKIKKPIDNVKINTIADSLSAPLHMPYSFNICQDVIDRLITVTDIEMVNAMKFMFENFKTILEPACVAGVAALLGPLKNQLANQKTVILLCGSNIDVKSWNNLVFN
jgi:threonine dehydratase